MRAKYCLPAGAGAGGAGGAGTNGAGCSGAVVPQGSFTCGCKAYEKRQIMAITFDQHAQCALYSFVFINHSLYFITWRVTASKKALVSMSSCPLLDEARKILFSDKRE